VNGSQRFPTVPGNGSHERFPVPSLREPEPELFAGTGTERSFDWQQRGDRLMTSALPAELIESLALAWAEVLVADYRRRHEVPPEHDSKRDRTYDPAIPAAMPPCH
jgi:hypothetical protein